MTAARSGEVRGARWGEVDLDRKLWSIPAERMKAGEAHVVPLSEGAIAILEKAKSAASSEVIFPGVRGQPLSDATLSKVLRETKRHCTVHGFRSSFRDWAAETMTMPGEVAEAALAHTVQNKVEAAYRRTKYLEQRRTLMAEWDRFLRNVA
jgi:integrase